MYDLLIDAFIELSFIIFRLLAAMEDMVCPLSPCLALSFTSYDRESYVELSTILVVFCSFTLSFS